MEIKTAEHIYHSNGSVLKNHGAAPRVPVFFKVSNAAVGREAELGDLQELHLRIRRIVLLVTTSKALVTTSVALVPSSFLLLGEEKGSTDG